MPHFSFVAMRHWLSLVTFVWCSIRNWKWHDTLWSWTVRFTGSKHVFNNHQVQRISYSDSERARLPRLAVRHQPSARRTNQVTYFAPDIVQPLATVRPHLYRELNTASLILSTAISSALCNLQQAGFQSGGRGAGGRDPRSRCKIQPCPATICFVIMSLKSWNHDNNNDITEKKWRVLRLMTGPAFNSVQSTLRESCIELMRCSSWDCHQKLRICCLK